MLRDLGHPAAAGEAAYDTTYENVQAGERTSHLFRLANHNGALVVGTGDLSELALGWCTYGVGDQMSHYNVNASVPKTLVQFLIRWVADAHELGDGASEVLRSVLDTAISPELVRLPPRVAWSRDRTARASSGLSSSRTSSSTTSSGSATGRARSPFSRTVPGTTAISVAGRI